MFELVGHAGIRWDDFWEMSWMEFNYQVEGHHQREKDEWRRTREIFTMIYNVNAKHKKSSQQLMPIDEEVQTSEEAVKSSMENYWKWRRSLTPEEYREWQRKVMGKAIKSNN